jgi:ABC-2 type transport system permease protein
VILSSCLLRMPWDRVAFFGAVITVMTFTLNGLAAGLGVLYPNFKESNPSKIVSGFGGTFCLVLSFIYILGSIMILALGQPEMRTHLSSETLAGTSVALFFLLSFLIGWLPFYLGLRQLRHFEF